MKDNEKFIVKILVGIIKIILELGFSVSFVLLILKITSLIKWSWMQILIPIWISLSVTAAIITIYTIVSTILIIAKRRDKK